MAWLINYSDTAAKQLHKIDKTAAARIVNFMSQRISVLEKPRDIGKSLVGQYGDYWRYRVGDYRIIVDIQEKLLCVLVVQIGHRREIY